MSKAKSMEELFHMELYDVYDAEHRITKALPKMAEKATDPKLKLGFETHLRETEMQIKRLEQVFDTLGIKAEKETCEATKGLLEEGEQIMKEIEQGPVLDAALIAAAQKVEHYEIATYGTLCCWARDLGYSEVESLLKATLDEEKSTDVKLTTLAEERVNQRAESAPRAA